MSNQHLTCQKISLNIIFAILLFICYQRGLSQITLISDSNFEQTLIDRGIDSNGMGNCEKDEHPFFTSIEVDSDGDGKSDEPIFENPELNLYV